MNNSKLKQQSDKLLRQFISKDWNEISPDRIYETVGPDAPDDPVMPDLSPRIFDSEAQMFRSLKLLCDEGHLAKIKYSHKDTKYGLSSEFRKLSQIRSEGKLITLQKIRNIQNGVKQVAEVRDPIQRSLCLKLHFLLLRQC